MKNFSSKWNSTIREINKKDWLDLDGNHSIPFYTWDWLYSLEKSNSIIARYGWQPLYLSIWYKKKLISIAPLFLKGHSYGEFIFDQQFLQLADKLGLNYYPKLIGMSPVSPIEGYRFLFAHGEDQEKLTKLMIERIDEFCINNNILSCNFLYVDKKWSIYAEKAGCSLWINKNSLWCSENDKNFTDYLSHFNSNQRRNIKRERSYIKKCGIQVSVQNGESITLESLALMYDFYTNHCARWGLWGSKYLTKEFFEELSLDKHRDNIVLFTAHDKDKSDAIAMSLCITNQQRLWGRYWGSNKDIDFLHFELCYYSPIEWALENGIKSFDPGAGGNQKKRRGFLAKEQISLHRWYEPTMDNLIKLWLPKVNDLMKEEIKATNNEVPFKYEQPKLS
tara:strand:+ start:5444 stop:6619 length:1176 start_codon:yes stop_codon:yes gene_type:complete